MANYIKSEWIKIATPEELELAKTFGERLYNTENGDSVTMYYYNGNFYVTEVKYGELY